MKIRVKIAQKKKENIQIKTDFIKLEGLLKYESAAMTGGEAKVYITEGMVKVNGQVCTARGKKIYPGDTVTFRDTEYIISGTSTGEV